ncbi:MAG TPA: HAMP domain-containing protein [Chloroflexota bacterium]|nr:HAMP domain-containing protein [Chloroflexota bacterium]
MLRNSVRLRLLVLLLLLALIPLAAVGYVTASREAQNTRDTADAALRDGAQRAALSLAQSGRTYVNLADYLANLQAIKTAITLDPWALQVNPFDDQVQALSAANPTITGVYLTTPTGTFLYGGALLEPNVFGPASDLPVVAGNPLPGVVTDAVRGAPALRVVNTPNSYDALGDLWVASRVLDQGTVLGAILLRVDASVLLPPTLAGMNAGGHHIEVQVVADSLIFDSRTAAALAKGTLPVAAGAGVAGYTTEPHPALATALSAPDISSFTDDGIAYTAAAATVPGFPWRVIARQPTSEITASSNSLLSGLLIAGLLIIVFLGIGITLTVSNFVVGPLARMREIVRGISQGRLDTPLPTTSSDELGTLAASIEEMRRGLQADAEASQRRAQGISNQVLNFTQALEPISNGQLYRRIPLIDDPESPLVDAVEATNNLIRRFRRLVAGVKDAVAHVVESSLLVRSRIEEAAQDAVSQQDQLEHQRELVTAMSRGAAAAGEAAAQTAAATDAVSAQVAEGGLALDAVSMSSDGIRQRTLENTNRIKKLQDTAINLTGLVGQVQDMAGSLQLLAYNGTLNATRAGGDPAFARMAEETQALAASFETSLTEIKAAVEMAQRDIGSVILSGEGVAQDVVAALRARDRLASVFTDLADVVKVLESSATSARAKATEGAELAAAVREGNEQVALVYERIRLNLEAAAEEITLRSADLDRLAQSVSDLQIEASASVQPQVGPRSAA